MSIETREGIGEITARLKELDAAMELLDELHQPVEAGHEPPNYAIKVEVSRNEAVQIYERRIEGIKERLRELGVQTIKRVQ